MKDNFDLHVICVLLKDKVAFGSMFSKSMYGDRELELKQKQKKLEDEKQKAQDDWVKSKMDRRDRGLEEQTFEEWKKENDENKKKDEEEGKKAREAKKKVEDARRIDRPLNSKKDSQSSVADDEEYDEEEAKIIAETKSKGYCYFRNVQSKLLP